jgi:hypothetical protein
MALGESVSLKQNKITPTLNTTSTQLDDLSVLHAAEAAAHDKFSSPADSAARTDNREEKPLAPAPCP